MGRPPTSKIKERKKVNFYLKKEVDRLIEQQHIEVQARLGHRVDKALFQEALVKAGLDRTDEVVEFLRQDVESSG
ncbi:hypothetical protein KA005_44490 [bacterium]|nr:hypothetical protein [bacterium]